MSTRLKIPIDQVSLPSTDHAHLTRFIWINTLGSPVFMLHSTLQDGSTFLVMGYWPSLLFSAAGL